MIVYHSYIDICLIIGSEAFSDRTAAGLEDGAYKVLCMLGLAAPDQFLTVTVSSTQVSDSLRADGVSDVSECVISTPGFVSSPC